MLIEFSLSTCIGTFNAQNPLKPLNILGNDYIHQLTKHQDQRLHISLTAVNGSEVTADYALFYIGDESGNYSIFTVSAISFTVHVHHSMP